MSASKIAIKRALHQRVRNLFRIRPGRTYVAFRDGDPWDGCHVTVLPHTSAVMIGGRVHWDCFLPKRWRKVAKDKADALRPFKPSELW